MKYDWKKIIDNQQLSGLTINNYCKGKEVLVLVLFIKIKNNF